MVASLKGNLVSQGRFSAKAGIRPTTRVRARVSTAVFMGASLWR
jgi:hypothetical protein